MYFIQIGDKHRLSMEIDLQSLFGLHVTSCTQLYSLAKSPELPFSPRIWTRIRGRYWSAKIDDISLEPPGDKCLPAKLINRRGGGGGGEGHLKLSQKIFNQASLLISIEIFKQLNYNVLSGISIFCRQNTVLYAAIQLSA
jgi:hypothetical protein